MDAWLYAIGANLDGSN